MGQTLALFDAALKDYYTDRRLTNLVNEERPLLALLNKSEKFPGRKMPIPIKFGNPRSRSATFSQAQGRAASVASSIESFDLTRVTDHAVVTIDTDVMEASEDDVGAWVDARSTEIDGAIATVSDALEASLFRSGYGSIGQVGSSTGSTITLADINDVSNFFKGDEVVFAQSDSGHVLRDSGDSLIVAGVNRSTGVVTFTAAVSGITGLANNDFIFIKGDRENSATPARWRPAGLAAWCPETAPSSGENFFGVDRSVDSLLYGQYYDGSSDDIEDALIEGANRVARLGFKIDHYLISFEQYSRLTKRLHDARRFVDVMVGDVGFSSFVIHGAKGPIKVVPSQFCPRNRAFGIALKHLTLHTIKKAVRINQNDGNMMLRQASADGVEVRIKFTGNLACECPASLIQVKLAAV